MSNRKAHPGGHKCSKLIPPKAEALRQRLLRRQGELGITIAQLSVCTQLSSSVLCRLTNLTDITDTNAATLITWLETGNTV